MSVSSLSRGQYSYKTSDFLPRCLEKTNNSSQTFFKTISYSQAKPEIYCYDRVDFWAVVTKSRAFLYSTFGHSYRTRNILTRFWGKCPTFGHFYRTRNILTRFWGKSPTFGHSYRTRNFWWSNLSFIVDILNCQESFSQNYSNTGGTGMIGKN